MVVLVPTRGRPQALGELLDAWEETGATCSLIFAVDSDDPCRRDYEDAFRLRTDHDEEMPFVTLLFVGKRLRLAGTLNMLCSRVGEDFSAIGFMGDDHRPRTKGWDERFAECLSGGSGIVYGNDLLVGDKFPTAVMMTADIPLKLGYFCPPGLVHLCLDLVWKDWGVGMERITYLGDVVIEHMHPANGKAALDAGYEECNSGEQVSADTEAYFAYKATQFAEDVEKLRGLL